MDQIVSEDIIARRRAIAERVKSRLAARGTPVNDNPRYDALVERWIAGEIEMQEVARGYADVRRAESSSRRNLVADHPIATKSTSAADLIGDTEKVIGIYEPDLAADR